MAVDISPRVKSVSLEIAGRTLLLETGRLAEQAHGAVVVRYGDTMVLVTVVGEREPRDDVDFFPLTVDYEEKMYAAGKIPGGFIKREGRPTEQAILAARLTDRPIRPLFPKGYRSEVQVITTVLSADQENDPDILSIIGASAALMISPIPFEGPVGAVRVGLIDGEIVINPTLFEVIEKAILDPDLTDVPYDYVGGRDFRITKTRKGEWANYSSSSFSMKTRSLNETELMAIEKYGLFNLKEFLGRVPDSDELAALKAMLDASLRGEPYDYASFGKYYKPFSRGGSDASISEAGARQVAETVPAKPVTSETHGGEPAFQASLSPATVAAAPVTTGKPDPREIIERIRQRTAAQ